MGDWWTTLWDAINANPLISGGLGLLVGAWPTIQFILDQGNRLPFRLARSLSWFRRSIFVRRYFVAVPMAALPEGTSEYADIRKLAGDVSKAIVAATGPLPFVRRVYCAALQAEASSDFDAPQVAVEDNIRRIKRTDYFILIYPTSVPTSALTEIGIAIAFEKPSIIFRESKTNLPYLLRQIEGASVPGVRVRQFEYRQTSDILDLIRRNGQRLFRKGA